MFEVRDENSITKTRKKCYNEENYKVSTNIKLIEENNRLFYVSITLFFLSIIIILVVSFSVFPNKKQKIFLFINMVISKCKVRENGKITRKNTKNIILFRMMI